MSRQKAFPRGTKQTRKGVNTQSYRNFNDELNIDICVQRWSILLGGQGDHVRLSSINGGRFVCFYVGCSDLIKKNWVNNWCQKYKSKFITSFHPYVLPFHQLDQTQWADLEAKWGMSQHFVEQTCYKSPSYLPCENLKKKISNAIITYRSLYM